MDKIAATQQGAVTTVHITIKAGWRQAILFISDVHFDSVKCNRELLAEHLQEAKRRGAWIISVGDFVEAMQGRFDPRWPMGVMWRCSMLAMSWQARSNIGNSFVSDIKSLGDEPRLSFAIRALRVPLVD